MQITLHPVAALPGQPDDAVAVAGETIIVNGIAHDLSAVAEGGAVEPPGDHPFAGAVTRRGGALQVPLRLHYDSLTAAPCQPADPAHWRVTLDDGPLPDLILRRPGS